MSKASGDLRIQEIYETMEQLHTIAKIAIADAKRTNPLFGSSELGRAAAALTKLTPEDGDVTS